MRIFQWLSEGAAVCDDADEDAIAQWRIDRAHNTDVIVSADTFRLTLHYFDFACGFAVQRAARQIHNKSK